MQRGMNYEVKKREQKKRKQKSKAAWIQKVQNPLTKDGLLLPKMH